MEVYDFPLLVVEVLLQSGVIVQLSSCVMNLTLKVSVLLLGPSENLLKLVYFLFVKMDVLGAQSKHLLKFSDFSSQSVYIICSIGSVLAIKHIF